MVVTFPHLGNSYLAVKAVFDSLGIPLIIPEFNNKSSLDKGCRVSPEEICLPFKLMMGNLIDSIDKGADTVIMVGSCGPCRFGEYCQLQMDILKNLGYKIDYVVLDSPLEIGKKEFMNRLSKLVPGSGKSRLSKYKALLEGFFIIQRLESFEARAKYLSGYEINHGECLNIINKCKKEALTSRSSSEMLEVISRYNSILKFLKVDTGRKPLKIAIIGEIYTIIEPYSNMNIEEKLMQRGVSIIRRITPGWWLKDTMLKPVRLNSRKLNKAADKYVPYAIGGFSRECIGEAVLAAKSGCDGAIQVFPMGCMPEIVSKSILPAVSKDYNLPVLSLIMDEITGDAGYITRIEAFLDLLERRKDNVSFGH